MIFFIAVLRWVLYKGLFYNPQISVRAPKWYSWWHFIAYFAEITPAFFQTEWKCASNKIPLMLKTLIFKPIVSFFLRFTYSSASSENMFTYTFTLIKFKGDFVNITCSLCGVVLALLIQFVLKNLAFAALKTKQTNK